MRMSLVDVQVCRELRKDGRVLHQMVIMFLSGIFELEVSSDRNLVLLKERKSRREDPAVVLLDRTVVVEQRKRCLVGVEIRLFLLFGARRL